MHKEQLIKHLAKKHRRPQHYYQEAINEIFAGIQEQLAQGKHVTFIGFGTFYTGMRPASEIRNFKTKQKMKIGPVRLAKFRAGRNLKQAVRRSKGAQEKRPSLLARLTNRSNPKKK